MLTCFGLMIPGTKLLTPPTENRSEAGREVRREDWSGLQDRPDGLNGCGRDPRARARCAAIPGMSGTWTKETTISAATASLCRRPRMMVSPIASSFPGSRFWRIFNWSRGGIGVRLLAAVLLFSSIVTLTLTALQLYLDYDREVSVIETRLDEIGRSYLGSIGESLWNLDQNQLELQLNGILRLPDIQAAEISEIADRPNPIRIAVGTRGPRSIMTRQYPLDYVMQGGKRQIGVL